MKPADLNGHSESQDLRNIEEDLELLKCGVPLVLMRARFESFIPADASSENHANVVREFAQQAVGFLILIGGFGNGKTHLAVAAMRHFRRPILLKQATLLMMLRETYRNPRARDPVDLCQQTSLLVLDEMGVTAGGKDELPMLHEILDYRYGHKLPTILTSNLALNTLRLVVGERMHDRLKEACYAVLHFNGESHRSSLKDTYFSKTHGPHHYDCRLWWEEPRHPNI